MGVEERCFWRDDHHWTWRSVSGMRTTTAINRRPADLTSEQATNERPTDQRKASHQEDVSHTLANPSSAIVLEPRSGCHRRCHVLRLYRTLKSSRGRGHV